MSITPGKSAGDDGVIRIQYDTAREKLRDKLKKAKKGLTKNSRNEDLENYVQMCFDAAVDLQDLSKLLKAEAK